MALSDHAVFIDFKHNNTGTIRVVAGLHAELQPKVNERNHLAPEVYHAFHKFKICLWSKVPAGIEIAIGIGIRYYSFSIPISIQIRIMVPIIL